MATFDVELLETKEFRKYSDLADEKNAKELIQKPSEELEKELVACEMYEQEVRSAKLADKSYQGAKEVIKDFNAGERGTLKPVKAKKALIVKTLRSRK